MMDCNLLLESLAVLRDALPEGGTDRNLARLAIDHIERNQPTERDAKVMALGELALERLNESPGKDFILIYRDRDAAAFEAVTSDRAPNRKGRR